MLIKGKIEKVNELNVSPFDMVRVLLPLVDAHISFHYSVATALPQIEILLPSSIADLAKISATELWRKMWNALERKVSRET